MAYRQVSCRRGRPGFQPQCSHLTMTRLYGLDFVCESCHRPGSFGWVYRCTQDREELIEDAASKGCSTAFDGLGHRLNEKLGTRKGSPAARDDVFSFLDETRPQHLATYSSEQVDTILKQRGNLKTEIIKERARKHSALEIGPFRQSSERENQSPQEGNHSKWVCADDEECQYKICPFCRPSYAERSYVNLNAVLNGELPPTAATGFGFHGIGERPIVDANLVRNLGLRPPPTPSFESNVSLRSLTPDVDLMEMLDNQLRSCGFLNGDHKDDDLGDEKVQSLEPTGPRKLTHSRKYDNLKACAQLGAATEQPTEALVKEPAQLSSQGEVALAQQSLDGFKIDCVVVDHVGSVSSPEPDEGTDYLVKIRTPRVEQRTESQ